MTSARLGAVDLSARLAARREYEARLAALQLRMLQIQQAFLRDGLRAVLVFEGWDAAGKGGAISRLAARLDPRRVHVWPIGAPTADELARPFLYRFWTRLPVAGEIVVFDRSWYGRVLVERVEGLAEEVAWRRAYDEIAAFERMLVDDGTRLVKLFLHVSADAQLRRFRERIVKPHKRWKITAEDLRNFARRPAYIQAIEDMLARTDRPGAPWHVIAGDHKWWARIAVLEAVTKALGEGLALEPPAVSPAVRSALANIPELADLADPAKSGPRRGKDGRG